MQNRLIETDLAYVGIGEHAGKERYFRPELFVFNVEVPTLMDFLLSHDTDCHTKAHWLK